MALLRFWISLRVRMIDGQVFSGLEVEEAAYVDPDSSSVGREPETTALEGEAGARAGAVVFLVFPLHICTDA